LAPNTFDEETLKLQIDPEKVAVNFTAIGNNNKHVVISRLEED